MAIGTRDNTATIYRELRAAILRGSVAPGADLSQVKIAEDFGVSRGPVREALRLLEREGLVEAELNRRVRVTPLSPEDLEHLYALRIVNEAFGIRVSVPYLTEEELASLQADIDEMTASAGTDVGRWETVHRRFHHSLIAYSGARIVRLIDQLYDHAER